MRIFIDLQWMKPGQTGGIETLARALLAALLRFDFTNTYAVLLPSETRYDFDLRGHSNARFYALDGPGYGILRALDEAASLLHLPHQPARDHFLQRAARQADVALAIPGYIAPALRHLPTVLIVPDIQHVFFPHFFSPFELERRTRYFSESMRAARHLCAISELTKATLIEKSGIPEGKITTIHLAADPIFQAPASDNQVQKICEKYGLSRGKYLYYPAATWPHKNHRTALFALHQLIHQHGCDLHIAFSGPTKEAQPEVDHLVEELGLAEKTRFLGFVPLEDMPALYTGAAAMVFPSLFEGFGMPVLEAMRCGCPVVCSNTTSLPEVAGDAAILADPLSPEQFARGILALTGDADCRTALVRKGFTQAERFTWVNAAARILALLNRAAHMEGAAL